MAKQQYAESTRPDDGPRALRIGEPDGAAGAAVYLASSDSAFMTGHAVIVDGGMVFDRRPRAATPRR